MAPLDIHIPTPTIVAMIAVIAVLLGFTAVVSILLMRKYEMNLSSIILGFLMYVVFDTILLNLFDSFLLSETSLALKDLIYSTAWSYTLYFAFINALFYTAGFNVVLRVAMNSDTGVGSGIAVGIGTGISYVVLGVVIPLINNVTAALEINKIGASEFLAKAEESNRQTVIDAIEALRNSSASDFLLSGYVKLMMFVILLSAATILYLAVTRRSPFRNLYVVLGMMILIFAPPALFTFGTITNPLLLQALMTVGAACFVIVAVRHVLKYGSNPLRH